MRFQVRKRLCPELLNYSWKKVEEKVEQAIQKYREGNLYKYLQNYQLHNGQALKPNNLNIVVLLEYFDERSSLLEPINRLNKYCDLRSDYVYQFEGVSSLEDKEPLVKDIYKIVRQITQVPEQNSFDILNQQIHFLLTNSL